MSGTLMQGGDGSGLEAGGDSSLAEGEVEHGGENLCQLFGTCSEGSSRNVVSGPAALWGLILLRALFTWADKTTGGGEGGVESVGLLSIWGVEVSKRV